MAAEVAAALAAAEAEARGSGLEDEEGEGRWKPAAGAAPSTLASAADRTRVGKVVGFFGRSVCPRVLCTYLVRSASIGFRQMSEPSEGQSIHPTLPYTNPIHWGCLLGGVGVIPSPRSDSKFPYFT